ncbi:hypothetical protein B0T24DRAFT_95961 [Lasiosphaeria ovina]|uniref:Uncharacterized protein n=1 Tax=Lasiosphaeria ovina TaxID=92902 RepID=A0AAE0JTZ2_9PEZI|nr:hypothetical protein B0T24DRAFT_95961 [Lasiosphaeria ovina]
MLPRSRLFAAAAAPFSAVEDGTCSAARCSRSAEGFASRSKRRRARWKRPKDPSSGKYGHIRRPDCGWRAMASAINGSSVALAVVAMILLPPRYIQPDMATWGVQMEAVFIRPCRLARAGKPSLSGGLGLWPLAPGLDVPGYRFWRLARRPAWLHQRALSVDSMAVESTANPLDSGTSKPAKLAQH